MIELTAEEHDEALRAAREDKYYRLKRIAYLESLNAPKKYPSFLGPQLFEIIKNQVTVDKENETIVQELCEYFSDGTECSLDLKKGICLFGNVGVGKTTLMEMFARNQRQSYVMKMCRAVEDEFSKDGDEVLKRYGVPVYPARNSDPFGHQELGYCFDDLGTEPMSKYYGKDTNVMAEVILNRYDNRLPFNQTHLTTNLSIEEIAARYGTRVTDRMRQMFNLISFPKEAKSRRK